MSLVCYCGRWQRLLSSYQSNFCFVLFCCFLPSHSHSQYKTIQNKLAEFYVMMVELFLPMMLQVINSPGVVFDACCTNTKFYCVINGEKQSALLFRRSNIQNRIKLVGLRYSVLATKKTITATAKAEITKTIFSPL